MDALRSFNRFELKYLIPTHLLPSFQQELKRYMSTDTYGDASGNYALSSLYYDTVDYRFYREKIDGIKFRRKLRIRAYETQDNITDETIVYVEIKQRIDRTTQKRRAPMRYADARQLCDYGILPQYFEPKDEAVIHEIQQMILNYQLKPACITTYFRQARQGTQNDPGLRITFDTNIRERHKDLNLDSKHLGTYMIDPTMSIMEIKANEHIPTWITHLIAEYNLRLIRISKYCQGLESATLQSPSKYHIV